MHNTTTSCNPLFKYKSVLLSYCFVALSISTVNNISFASDQKKSNASWSDIAIKAFILAVATGFTNVLIHGAYDIGKYYLNKEDRERTYQLDQKKLDLKFLIAQNTQKQQELAAKNIQINEEKTHLQKEQACIDRWNLMHRQWNEWCTSPYPEVQSLCEQTKAGIIVAFNQLPPSYIENNNKHNALTIQKDTEDEDT